LSLFWSTRAAVAARFCMILRAPVFAVFEIDHAQGRGEEVVTPYSNAQQQSGRWTQRARCP